MRFKRSVQRLWATQKPAIAAALAVGSVLVGLAHQRSKKGV